MPHPKFIAHLQAIEGLSDDERRQIAALPSTLRQVSDGETLLRQGEDTSRCVFVVSGFLYQARIVGDRSQILAFHVPGDMPCLHTLLVSPMDADLVGLGPSLVGYVAHSQLKQLLDGSIHLTRAFWRETLIDAAISRQWIARLGAQAALPKVAHLICELAARLEVVGLVKNGRFQMPMTQRHVADACGLSIVHVNRTIQELRGRRLIAWEGSEIELLQPDELRALADFTPDYLT
ncbi:MULTISPECIES: Crp/Fnr family transcriptional regulator [Bradyrhizobium]|jgi:CRP-like cAMP-binding protein|uniref:cAMP-binding protein n=1 Tax=Bradyrhizobium canariense TaxID=255045 RepID=A0A1X3FBV0_9BRAD|nr:MULTISPECIES: Crp/Fnr family transcriptional regulator [Bradyrhizobium]MBM7482160.1 CRP-like cAMP-binding protein [Bradyrhizobium canariense]MCK1323429.1 Crp/Fnr family transcriptional regulator [Bradyrhizobium sp. 156]MCK1331444.1 Crp/Fnr family transcriptional regulator [Bradyrhizobium sp. CW9]MCK1345354.1 Crp/Fnr family transcriptional regulator [Bradyrhizobium sp. CW11]MCK1451166.1 Crp/Fnr family transcriptional regulator [Bradyrhizobium sp. 35]